jgi:broad specificity phosphatase PhoE
MKSIHLYLLRHSESQGNTRPNIIGQTADTTLTELGLEQAFALGKRFAREGVEFDRIISSTYTRAQQTAKIVRKQSGFKGEIELDDRLVEYNPGSWLGKDRAEIMNDIDTYKRFKSLGMGFKFPGKNGESLNEVARRAMQCIEERIVHNEQTLKNSETKKQYIALFSHGMTVKSILSAILLWDPSFMWRTRIDNASITHLVYKPDEGWFLRGLNDISHLRDLNK